MNDLLANYPFNDCLEKNTMSAHSESSAKTRNNETRVSAVVNPDELAKRSGLPVLGSWGTNVTKPIFVVGQ